MTRHHAMQITKALTGAGRTLFEERLARRTFKRGRKLIAKGDEVSGAYFVLEGRLRVYTHGASGKEATLYAIEPGETCVLALNSLFNGVRYPAWVEAETDTVIGVLPGPAYKTLFAREPAVQDLTVRALSTAVFRLMEELEQRHVQKLDQRLANFLLLRADGDGAVVKTQQDIAAHIGTTREVVARILGIFVDQGLVATRRGRVDVLDRAGLAQVGGAAD